MNQELWIMNQEYKKKFGFTLIELLITLFITVLLVTLFIPYQRQFAKKNDLNTSMQQMKEEIFKAQSLAFAPASGNNYYRFVFYPNDNPISYQVLAGNSSSLDDPLNFQPNSTEKVIENGTFPSDIQYKSGVIYKNIGNNKNQGTIIFGAPKGECDFLHAPGSIDYTFVLKDDATQQSIISVDGNTCAVNISSTP
jgi:prepilin-type N-terminal cleavage/methylation domain-containing protein